MTNNEILHADLLDILFENRNKAYGAYALRKNYHNRLQWALGIGLSIVFLLLTLQDETSGKALSKNSPPDVILTSVELPKPKAPEPPHIPAGSHAAQIRNTPVTIVPDETVPRPEVPTMNDLQTNVTSTIAREGVIHDPSSVEPNATGENPGTPNVTADEQPEVVPISSDAQFPGGKDAFAKFLTKNLIALGELEAGEKKVVLVHFRVGEDGTISKVEILKSDGEDYSNEVIRVLGKMPKWIPAVQHGAKVATWFTQPVSFIGVE